jgi:ParB family chromosome partitioning protein
VRKQLEKLLGKDNGQKISYIPLKKIKLSPFQPRHKLDDQELVDLARSIMIYGLIQPVVVRPWGHSYQIVAGERRFRACCLLGKSDIPAIVQEMDDEKAATINLIDNLQCRELNYLEEAYAYGVLRNLFSLNQEELARKIGRSQSVIASRLRLLKIPEYIRREINSDIVSERHVLSLLKLNSSEMQQEVIRQIQEKELTVKETEELVERLGKNNIPVESNDKNNSQNVYMIIRDARIFINTIKETVKRAKQTGVNIYMSENDNDEQYEITIRLAKQDQRKQALA